jgi:hypothetical protein
MLHDGRSGPNWLATGLGPVVGGESLFEQDWWLGAAGGSDMNRVEVVWDNVVVGRLSYRTTLRRGMRRLEMPPYTRMLAPVLTGPEASPSVRIINNIRILRELFDKAGRFDSYHAVVPSSAELVFPLQLNGFKASPKFTFVSDANVSLDDVLAGMHQKTRNGVRAAGRAFRAASHQNFDRFLRLSKIRSADRNDYGALQAIWDAVDARDAGTVITVEDPAGRDLAAALVVWDDRRVYFLASARQEGGEGSKAYTLLFFESLSLAKRARKDFDADGYATVESARALLKWGVPIGVNMNVRKESLPYEVLRAVKDRVASSYY